MTKARTGFAAKWTTASGVAAVAALLGFVLTASPLLAAEKHPPKYPPLTWCKQNPSRTTAQYAKDHTAFSRSRSHILPKEYSEVPSDVIMIPEHIAYAITGKTSGYTVPIESNGDILFGTGPNALPYFPVPVWDICKVVGPTGESWLVEGSGGDLDYIPMEKVVPLALYLAEMRLTKQLNRTNEPNGKVIHK